ncbi:MAG: adenylate/guanylate cyclase domain-containing protein [Inquilinaceae bacterium]
MSRRLAAIVAADIVGFSRLMGEDEAATLADLKTLRGLIDPLLATHGGRLVKTTGDGLLAEFASAVAAVDCAIAMQRGAATQAEGRPDHRRLRLRIGVNVGDIAVEDDDIFGDAVNIAARLEALAPTGGIAVSEEIYRHVRGHLKQGFTDAGAQQLKNIAQPVRVYHVDLSGTLPPGTLKAVAPPLPDRPSIAVLPLANLSGDPGQAYFSDGLTEDIITELSRFRQLFVIARNSSFVYRDRTVDVRQIGRELGVHYVLEGSVQKAVDRLRVTAQLVDAGTGHHLWAERYDRRPADIFDVQDELTQTIVATLAGRVQAAAGDHARTRRPEDLRAYDCLLRGLELLDQSVGADIGPARAQFEQAVARDPAYALAHASLALVHLRAWSWDGQPVWLDRAFEAAKRALALDPAESRCHGALGLVHRNRRQYDAALIHLGRAVALNPNDAHMAAQMGLLLTYVGRAEEGVDWVRKAIRLNPHHPYWYQSFLGIALYSARRYGEAVEAFRGVEDVKAWGHALTAAGYAQRGQDDAARFHADEALRQGPDFSAAKFLAGQPYQSEADLDHWRAGFRRAGLPD